MDRPKLLIEYEKSLVDEELRQVEVIRQLCEYVIELEGKINAIQKDD